MSIKQRERENKKNVCVCLRPNNVKALSDFTNKKKPKQNTTKSPCHLVTEGLPQATVFTET